MRSLIPEKESGVVEKGIQHRDDDPSAPNTNQLWVNQVTGNLKFYNGMVESLFESYLEGGQPSQIVSIPAADIDWSLGHVHRRVPVSGILNLTFSNVIDGEVIYAIITAGSLGGLTIGLPAGVKTKPSDNYTLAAGVGIVVQFTAIGNEVYAKQIFRAELAAFPSGSQGDLTVLNGQTVVINAGDIRDYNNVTINAGGTLEINGSSSGAITVLGVAGNLTINGTIRGNNRAAGGTYNLVTPNGESISYSATQRSGGRGGYGGRGVTNILNDAGGVNLTLSPSPARSVGGSASPTGIGSGGGGGAGGYTPNTNTLAPIFPHPPVGVPNIEGKDGGTGGASGSGQSFPSLPNISGGAGNATLGNGGSSPNATSSGARIDTPSAPGNPSFVLISRQSQPSGTGGGGGGGAGGYLFAPRGGTVPAPDRPNIPLYLACFRSATGGGGGGYKGTHGLGLYIYCLGNITGSGNINLSGTNGFNGGSSGSSPNISQPNPSFFTYHVGGTGGGGGGGAGGSGGKLWVRKPALSDFTVPVSTSGGNAGSGGARGTVGSANFPSGGTGWPTAISWRPAMQGEAGVAGQSGLAGSVDVQDID